nr:hypothetical protein [Tanacetum cinerariifolium]
MICNMDSIGKYMREIILHQQRTLQLLKQKKLMQTQEGHSNPIQAFNVDSLKVDFVVIQNTCSKKEDSNSETASSKSVNESSLNFETKDVHEIKYKISKAKENDITYFRSLHSHLQVLSKEDLEGTRIKHGFKRAFMSLYGQDADTFTNKYFVEYTVIEVKHFRDTLLQHMGNVKKSFLKEHVIKDSMIEGGTESKMKNDNSGPRNDTDTDDANIRAIYDEEPVAEEVNSHAKIQSYKTRNINKLVDQKSHTQKPIRQIFTRHRFSLNKTSTVYAKTSARSDLRWKPTGRIFKSVGLRWIPTGKLFDSCTSKDDSEPIHGLNVDILNIHERKETLDLTAGTSINVQKEQSLDLSAGPYVMSTKKISKYGC